MLVFIRPIEFAKLLDRPTVQILFIGRNLYMYYIHTYENFVNAIQVSIKYFLFYTVYSPTATIPKYKLLSFSLK